MCQLHLSMNSLAETSWTLILSNPSFTWWGVIILTLGPGQGLEAMRARQKIMLPSPRRDQRCWRSRSAPTSRESPAPASLSSLPHGSSYEHGGWRPSCPDGCCSAKMKKVINSGKSICLHNDAIVIFRGRVSYEAD